MTKERNADPQKQAQPDAATGEDRTEQRNTPDTNVRTERSGGAAATEANEQMGERFTGDGADGERGYRGDDAPDTPPGSVPGGSYGGGGGVSRGKMPDNQGGS